MVIVKEMCEDMNIKFQSVYTAEGMIYPTLPKWDEKVTMERIKIFTTSFK